MGILIWVALIIGTLIACELFMRLPVIECAQTVKDTGLKSVRVMASSAISDHWKERVLQRYSLQIATASFKAIGLLVLVFSPFIVLVVIGPMLGLDIVGALYSVEGIAVTSAVAVAFVFVRSKLSSGDQPDYPLTSRILHRVALGAPWRGEMMFDLESASAAKRVDGAEDTTSARHVFVAGLARAGTTVLMRSIYDSGAFASLTYRDMPFVMAPNLWARISVGSQRQAARRERAHGDGVMVDFDSPEALEEPFWRTFCGDDYIQRDALTPHGVDEETIGKYRRFVDHVLMAKCKGRYLAKNNNNVLRFKTLPTAFPESLTIIPFRDPRGQAASLLRQHLKFVDEQEGFTRSYMTWLVHHEFGQDHRPFVIDGKRPEGDPLKADYWLMTWVLMHRHLLAAAKDGGGNVIPIAYDDICQPDRAVWTALASKIGIPPGDPEFEQRPRSATPDFADDLGHEADALYEELRTLSAERLKAT